MKLREIIKSTTIASDVSCFVTPHRMRDCVNLDIGFVSKDRKQIFVADFTTAEALKLYEQLRVAFEVKPLTDAEVINRQEHHAFWKNKEPRNV